MAMKVSKIGKKPYDRKKETKESIKKEFQGPENKGGFWDDLKQQIMGDSLEDTMKKNQKKNLKKMKNK